MREFVTGRAFSRRPYGDDAAFSRRRYGDEQ